MLSHQKHLAYLFIGLLLVLMALFASTPAPSAAQAGEPIPQIEHVLISPEVPLVGQPFEIEIRVRNVGADSTRGGSISLSFPEEHEVTIEDASVPTVSPNRSNCGLPEPHIWLLGADTPCNQALQHNTACQEQVELQYPLVETWHNVWPSGEQHYIRVRVTPKTDATFVTAYLRTAIFSGTSGCSIVIEPNELSGDAFDQQNFPAQTLFIPINTDTTNIPAAPPTVPPIAPTETMAPLAVTVTIEPSRTATEFVAAVETPASPPTVAPIATSPSNEPSFLGLSDTTPLLMLTSGAVVCLLLFMLVFFIAFYWRRDSDEGQKAIPLPPTPHPLPTSQKPTRQWGTSPPNAPNTPLPYTPSPPPLKRAGTPMPATQPEFHPSPPWSNELLDATQAELGAKPAKTWRLPTRSLEPLCLGCDKPLEPSAQICTTCQTPVRIIGERYHLTRRLGKGGMGAVYLAEDKRITGKKWAVKEISDFFLQSERMKQKVLDAFNQEARLLANLSHPNLPRVIDFLNEDDKYYLVMDFVQGESLEHMLKEHGQPFAEADVLDWARQLTDVLHYLHTQPSPIIFRDLKPSNIMLTPTGKIQLIDFGIARLFKPGRAADTLQMGTPGYAPPEQFGQNQTDARSDIYALGVTLHHLLTNHDPATTPFRLPNARLLNPAISPRTATLLEKATQMDPAQRFATMMEMKQAFGS